MRPDGDTARRSRADLVETVARVGAAVALAGFRGAVSVETKGSATDVIDPGDVVTVADRRAQRACKALIADRFPSDTIVAEEGNESKTLPANGVAWVIDPIDGTYNYVRGLPTWATAVSVVADGDPVAAATHAPAVNETYVAENATSYNGQSVTVSDRERPATFAVAYTVVPEFGDRAEYASGIKALLERFGETRRVGSLQVALGRVATGALDGAVTSSTPRPWDSIGGVRMVRAAGGTVTDVQGRPWHPDSAGLVASNGRAHEELVAIAQKMRPTDDPTRDRPTG